MPPVKEVVIRPPFSLFPDRTANLKFNLGPVLMFHARADSLLYCDKQENTRRGKRSPLDLV